MYSWPSVSTRVLCCTFKNSWCSYLQLECRTRWRRQTGLNECKYFIHYFQITKSLLQLGDNTGKECILICLLLCDICFLILLVHFTFNKSPNRKHKQQKFMNTDCLCLATRYDLRELVVCFVAKNPTINQASASNALLACQSLSLSTFLQVSINFQCM
jgi:hypothetical protein